MSCISCRIEVPCLDAKQRVKNFAEVEKGYSKEQALQEAGRCLQCANPSCEKGCAAGVKIKEFIAAFRNGDGDRALEIIEESNFFPRICGRICQHGCESSCVLAKKGDAINIRGLERFVADNYSSSLKPNKVKKKSKKRVAVVGSGPSGLTVAVALRFFGFKASVFEASKIFGGVIKYGVPEFRLPVCVVEKELKKISQIGVEFESKTTVGEKLSLGGLKKKFDAVFVGTGTGEPKILDVPAKSLSGIIPALNLLVARNLHGVKMVKKGEKVVVVGAGFVGLDSARTAARLGAKVTVVSASKKKDLRECKEAEEEGVVFKELLRPERFLGEGILEGIQLRKLKEVNGKIVETKEFEAIKCGKAVLAVGLQPAKDSFKKEIRTSDGLVHVDKNYMTSIPGIFAAGDCVTGPKNVIGAIASGAIVAKHIKNFLENG